MTKVKVSTYLITVPIRGRNTAKSMQIITTMALNDKIILRLGYSLEKNVVITCTRSINEIKGKTVRSWKKRNTLAKTVSMSQLGKLFNKF